MNYTNRIFATLLAICLCTFPSLGLAVGLGKLSVNSQLGQPLDLEVELLSVTSVELGSMTVGLASRSDFARADVLYPDSAALLNFEIKPGTTGDYYISITSDNPINDTYLHLLISASWSGGKVVREYTALLDPPLYSGDSTAVVNVPSTSGPSEQIATEEISGQATTTSAQGFAGDTITVQEGDTLSGIVSRLGKPDNVSLFQGLTALQNENPEAFIDGNMNRLRAGAVLRVPSFESMSALSPAETQANFSDQLADYNEFLAEVGALQTVLPELDGASSEQSSSTASVTEEEDITPIPEVPLTDLSELDEDLEVQEEISTTEEQEAQLAQAEEEARLRIGQEESEEQLAQAASGELGDDAQVDALKTQLAELDASLLASGVESDEVKDRLKTIQAQVERMSRLLEIEDSGLALTQEVVTDDETAEGETNLEEGGETGLQGADEEVDVAAAVEQAAQDLAATSTENELEVEEEEVAVEDTQPEETAAETESEQAEVASVASSDQADEQVDDQADSGAEESAGPTRQVVASSGIMDTVSGLWKSVSGSLGSFGGVLASISDYAMKIAAALIALLAGLFFYRRYKSRQEFEESMLDIESEQISSNSGMGLSSQRISKASGIDLASNDSALELTIGGGMSFLSEEGVTGVAEEENEVIQAGVVDPLAEADVYLAYDRDEQAIQVLKEAYAQHPEREELAEKLLEIYHKQDDRRAFDALAGEFQTRISSPNSSTWGKVMEMGREISPGNPLYRSETEAAGMVMDEPDDVEIVDRDGDTLLEKADDAPVEFDIGDDELDLASSPSEATAIQELDVDDLELLNEPRPKSDAMDAPTLSQIIQSSDQIRQEPVVDVADEVQKDDDIELEEIEFNLGEDELDITEEAEDPQDSQKDSLQSITGNLEEEPTLAELDALEEDSYLSEASEQSIGKLEPYHESETALELAKAYIELGEKEIAKGFIEEVINEGSDKQKQKAEKLVKTLTE